MASEHFVKVERTARYYTLGEWSDHTDTLWIVCHGYAQLAGDFINQFEVLANGHTAIVAPEGLSRFYPKTTNPYVGASWMTREDRLHEIEDYVAYLNQCYALCTEQLPNLKKVHVLGFSQACATVCRWAVMGKPAFNHLWLFGGEIPHDIDLFAFRSLLHQVRLHILIGKEDHLISEAKLEAAKQLLAKEQIPYTLQLFDGGHVVNMDLLAELALAL